MNTTAQSPIATGLARYIPPITERALEGNGMPMLQYVAALESSLGGIARTEAMARRFPTRAAETLAGLDNAGLVVVKLGSSLRGTIRMTDAGWAKVRGDA